MYPHRFAAVPDELKQCIASRYDRSVSSSHDRCEARGGRRRGLRNLQRGAAGFSAPPPFVGAAARGRRTYSAGAAPGFAVEAADGESAKCVKPMGKAKEEKHVKRQVGKTTSILIFCLLGPPRQVGKRSLKKQAQVDKTDFDICSHGISI